MRTNQGFEESFGTTTISQSFAAAEVVADAEADAEAEAALPEAAGAEAALPEAAAVVPAEVVVSVVLLAQATRQRTIATARSRAISFFIVFFPP